MGKIITASSDTVAPKQSELAVERVIELAQRYEHKGVEGMIPTPVREHQDRYHVLDGHHGAVVQYLATGGVRLYVAQDSKDLMNLEEFPYAHSGALDSRNYFISNRFDGVLKTPGGMDGITELEDLVRKYSLREKPEIKTALGI